MLFSNAFKKAAIPMAAFFILGYVSFPCFNNNDFTVCLPA